MSALILPSRFNQQPQGATQIDWDKPINRKLLSLTPFNGPHGYRDLVSGKTGTITGSYIKTAVRNGVYPLFGASDYYTLPDVPAIGIVNPFTIAWTQAPTATVSYGNVLNINFGQAGTNNRFLILQSSSDSNYYFNVGPQGKYSCIFGPTTGALTVGKLWRCVLRGNVNCLTNGGSSYDLFINGAKIPGTSGTAANDLSSNVTAAKIIGQGFPGAIGNLHFWSRPLTDKEGVDWSLNEFITLKKRPLYLFPASGGVGAQTLTPTLYSNAHTFYAPTVAAGAVTLTPSLFTNDQTFYAATVSQSGALQTLAPTLFTNSNTFYSHTVSPGTVTLAAGLFSNDQSFYAHTLTTNYGLVATLLTNSPAFYAPSVSAGEVTLTPSLFTNAQTFYSHIVTQDGGPQYLVPGLYSNSQTFYSPSVVPGSVTLTATRLDNSQTFFAPAITQGTVTQSLTPELLTNVNTFFAHSLAVGAVSLTPLLYVNAQTFYATTISHVIPPVEGEVTLSAQTIADLAEAIANAIYAHPSAVTSQQIATFVWDENL